MSTRVPRTAFLDLLAAALAAKASAEDGDTRGACEHLHETAARARCLADQLAEGPEVSARERP